MNRLCNIAYTTTKPQPFVKHGNKTLSHRNTVIFSNNVRIVGINTPIVHVILNIEECDGRVDIYNNHEEG